MPPDNRKVLVVGGRGFLGGFIVASLRRHGWQVRVLARANERRLDADEVAGDITCMLSAADWAAALTDVSVVVNAAGILREEGRQRFEDVHVRAPMALAEACAERGIRFVQVSALGDPRDGGFIASKHRFDQQLLVMAIDAVVLRPSVVYSERGSYGGTSLLRALAAFPWRQLMPGDGHWCFQPVAAQDLAEVVSAACASSARGVFELGCEQPITLAQYQDQWRRWLGIPGTATWRVPLPLVRAQVWFGERLGRGPVNRTIWNMLLRGNRTGENAWQTVRDTFGVRLRALGEVLADTSSQMQDRWAAQLYFLAPCLKWAMVALWLASAWVGWLTPASDIERFAQNSLLAEFAPVLTARLSAGLDLLLGLGLALARRPRPVVLAMLAMTLAYLVCIGVAMPAAFMEPLGGLIKNLALLPALAVLWVVVDRR
jgi:uncharacterized protein YbjT (DUF2867 family)